ncbi:MAG: DHH family phosphoesterase [Deltaproteobacteria bacterium]|jgi:nanoRNase/pAp phosphatase (c-di-AMP/oligoRNAs hydrolase)|nr:DHH family phosphoesterase [Deltaproteobacteria bacterium]
MPLTKFFNRDDRILIIITADPDSIASAVALKRLLWRKVSQVVVASTNVVKRPDNLRLISALKLRLPLLADTQISSFTKLALVDSQPDHNPQTANLNFAIVVDHHPICLKNIEHETHFHDIRPDWGATASIFVNYLKSAKIRPNQILATALFYAIKTDTQNFVRQGKLEDMIAFRWLYPMIHQPLLSEIERAPISRDSFNLMLKALNQADFNKNYCSVYFQSLDHADTLVLTADWVMQINGVNRAITYGVHDKSLVVVMRSGGLRSSNLGRLAQQAFGPFGSAGGHRNMARAEIPLANIIPKHCQAGNLKNFVTKRLREALSRKAKGGANEANQKGTNHAAV